MCTTFSTLQSASAPYRCCPLLSRFEHIDRRTCLGMSEAAPFSLSKFPLYVWGSGPPSNTWFLGPRVACSTPDRFAVTYIPTWASHSKFTFLSPSSMIGCQPNLMRCKWEGNRESGVTPALPTSDVTVVCPSSGSKLL